MKTKAGNAFDIKLHKNKRLGPLFTCNAHSKYSIPWVSHRLEGQPLGCTWTHTPPITKIFRFILKKYCVRMEEKQSNSEAKGN